MSSCAAAILGIATHFPSNVLSNDQLARDLGGEWTADKILAKTGIATRFIADADQCASDLGVRAAEKLFASDVCAAADVDFLLFCTQSPDYFLPATSCTMQHRLGLRTGCGALDFNQGCSGFIYGLALAKGLIESGAARRVLLVTAETYSKFINQRDRSARTIFGDGAAAVLVGSVPADRELIGPFVFGTDGRGAANLLVPAGGLRRRTSAATEVEHEDASGNWRSAQNLYMDGPAIFSFTLGVVPSMVNRLLDAARLSMDQVDYFVFHQASRFMLDHLRTKMRIPQERFCLCLEHCGNTVSSTIPIALEQARTDGSLRPASKAMLVGFGVGLSWAATMFEVPDTPFWGSATQTPVNSS